MKAKKKTIKIIGLITGFLIAGNLEAIAQTIYENIEDPQSMFPIFVTIIILAAIFFIIKAIYKYSQSVNKGLPFLDVWYLVGLTVFAGIYIIAQEIGADKFELGSVAVIALGIFYFFIASKLWMKKTWAWNVSMALAYLEMSSGVALLVNSSWSPMAAVPLVINLTIVFLLIQPKVLQFYKKETNVFLKYVEITSETDMTDSDKHNSSHKKEKTE